METETRAQQGDAVSARKNHPLSIFQPLALTLVGALFELLVIGCLLNEVEDGDGEVGPRERVSLRVHSVVRHW